MNNYLTEEQQFEQMLQRDEAAIMNGTFQGWISQDLPEDAKLTDRLKFQFCQKIITYRQDYDLTQAELADKLDLSLKQIKDILYNYIDRLKLDDLAGYVDQLFVRPSRSRYQTGLVQPARVNIFQPAYA